MRRRTDDRERGAQRSEAADPFARLDLKEIARDGAHLLAEQRETGHGAPRVAQDLEDRERPAEQGLASECPLDHHELARPGPPGDGRRFYFQDVVRVGEAVVGRYAGVHIDR